MVKKSERAWLAFKNRVAECGGVVLESEWRGSGVPHLIRCSLGHETSPRPNHVQRGRGICRICSCRDSDTACRQFRQRVEELGGVLLEPSWLGAGHPHRVRCSQGHETAVRPDSARKGRGICRVCVGQSSEVAWERFQRLVTASGGVVLESHWRGSNTPHRVRCAAGHEIKPRPGDARRGKDLCRFCAARKTPEAGWDWFHAHVASLGGVVLEPVWLGVMRAHRIRCAEGHEAAPRPVSLQKGQGICRACAGKDPALAWRWFQDRVSQLGGTVLEKTWLGANTGHRVRCFQGHQASPRPATVQQGGGICRICNGREWTVFYVVADDEQGHVKFGVTSGDPRPRLRVHARDGLSRTVRLMEDLADAFKLERSVIATLRLAGEEPVRGREYFRVTALATILDVADNYTPAVSALRQAEQTQLF